MVRILARFGLSQPCSAPLQVIGHMQVHAISILDAVCRMGSSYPGSCQVCCQLRHELRDQVPQDIRGQLCDKLRALKYPQYSGCIAVSAELRTFAELHLRSIIPRVLAVYVNASQLVQVSQPRLSSYNLFW